MKKILVTGANGFLGQYIVRELKKEFEICDSDIHDCDVRIFDSIQEKMRALRPNITVHLAALCGAKESNLNPFNFFNTNEKGTANVVEACKQYGSKLIFASSLTVFGSCNSGAGVNEDSDKEPRHVYASTKAASEKLIELYAKFHKLNALILRPTLVVGPGCKEYHAIGDFIQTAKKGKNIKIYGDGGHIRDFIHPRDVASAFRASVWHLINQDFSGLDTFNLSSDEPISIKALSEMIAEKFDVQTEHTLPTDQTFSLFTSIEKASKQLDWKPKYSIREMIEELSLRI